MLPPEAPRVQRASSSGAIFLYAARSTRYAASMLGTIGQLGSLGVLALVIGLVIAVVIHEYGHARAAYALGDTTSADLGRMTLNPIPHIDFVGTIVIPVVLLLTSGLVFGWAKPVPIDPRNFRFPRRDALLTAFAGPAANLATAAVFGFAAQLLPSGTRLPSLAAVIVIVNLVLAFFNLIPIPPLDGSSILTYLLGHQPLILLQIQRQGFVLLVLFIVLDSLTGGRILGTIVGLPVTALSRLFLGSTEVL